MNETLTSSAGSQMSSGGFADYSYTYNVQDAVEYADEFVGHFYAPQYSKMNPEYYNTTAYVTATADCQNYVSECLVAGGIQKNSAWEYNQMSLQQHG